MNVEHGKIYAILTGDVVKSSDLEPSFRRQLPEILRRTGAELRSAFPAELPLNLDVFRGDSWQMLVARPEQALLMALALRSRLRLADPAGKADSRIAIGIGELDFVPDARLSEGDGGAFRASGRAMEQMEGRVRLDVRIEQRPEIPGIRAVVWLIDSHLRRWTEKQNRAIAGVLSGQTQEQIGSDWQPRPISQQAVGQHLDRANWYAIEKGIDAFAQLIRRFEGPSNNRLEDL